MINRAVYLVNNFQGIKLKFVKTLLNYEERLTGNTKNELAKYIGVTPQTVNNWINGILPRKKIYLERMADFFKLSYDDFVKLREQDILGNFNLTIQEFIQLRKKDENNA